jgi:hypothetical protein
MNIRSLRNVAVRMRPLAGGGADEGPGGPDALPPLDLGPQEPARDMAAHPAPPPAPPAPPPAATAPRRNIWDLDPEPPAPAPPPEPPAARTAPPAEPPGLTRPPRRPDPDFAQDAPRAPSARARTRILGFHAQELATEDGLAPGAAPRGPLFPAGWLVVVEGPGRGAYFAVSTQVSSIGRGADQDVALDFGDMSISRSGHASVLYDDEQNRFFIGHGNKANVVRRNGQPVLATEEMFDGDMIRIGKTTLRFVALCGAGFRWADTDAEGGADA